MKCRSGGEAICGQMSCGFSQSLYGSRGWVLHQVKCALCLIFPKSLFSNRRYYLKVCGQNY